MKTCNITEDQRQELIVIKQLLNSKDQESIKLGIGLLENYPQEARVQFHKSLNYSQKLGSTLCQYHIITDYFKGMFLFDENEYFWRKKLISFINAVLIFKKFYI